MRNQEPQKSLNTKFRPSQVLFLHLLHRIRSTIQNFWMLSLDSQLATPQIPRVPNFIPIK